MAWAGRIAACGVGRPLAICLAAASGLLLQAGCDEDEDAGSKRFDYCSPATPCHGGEVCMASLGQCRQGCDEHLPNCGGQEELCARVWTGVDEAFACVARGEMACVGLNDCSTAAAAPQCGELSCEAGFCRVTNIEVDVGRACDDGNLCTVSDRCSGTGLCDGLPKDCSGEADACKLAYCDTSSGQCIREPRQDGTPCIDAFFCTVGDSCQGGVCVGGAARQCPALECRLVTCNEEQDACTSEPVAAGAMCDDGVSCTTGDACNEGGQCTGAPDDAHCDDGDAETIDRCSPLQGCVHERTRSPGPGGG